MRLDHFAVLAGVDNQRFQALGALQLGYNWRHLDGLGPGSMKMATR